MADRNDAPPSMMAPSGTSGRVHPTAETGGRRGESVITEFLDAARSAAESLLQEQKRQIAERVSGVAEALRSTAQPLDRSQNRIMSRYVEQAADRVEEFSRNLRHRRWDELAADTEEFAQRQPTLFVLGAVAAGFVIGRLLWTSAAGEREGVSGSRASSSTTRTVTAAVSSGSGAGQPTGHTVGSPGAIEAR